MKTILGFDSWTEGSRYFERLAPLFEKNGYRLILIHIGSWGHDIGRPQEEMMGELCVRDISYYENRSVCEILDMENPSAVLFMSTRSFAHMAFNRYARHKNIPTCHMYHGLVMVQAFGKGEIGYKVNYLKHLSIFANRIKKNIFKLIPFYITSLLETSHTRTDWASLIIQLLRRGVGIRSKTEPYINDTCTNIGCVYTEADVEHMHQNYRISIDKIHIVGNSDLTVFGVKEKDIGYALSQITSSETLLYIDTALVEAGVVFSSVHDFIEHILHTRDELRTLGLGFAVKLHPAHYRTDTPDILVENGIDLCVNEKFINKLKQVIAVIVEPSSAAVIPALLGVPILLGQYGKLSGQAYGRVLSSYPRSRYLTNLSDVKNILSEEQRSLSNDRVKEWIEINRGPMPAEEMPKRAVEAMCNMVAENNSAIKPIRS